MAAIEELVSEIRDPDLRMRLQAEVRSLKEHKEFGLVFEEHVPERCVIPDGEVEVGDYVIDRADADAQTFKVVNILSKGVDLEPMTGGDIERHKLKDLQLLRRFGEPAYSVLTPIGNAGELGNKPRGHSVICGENYHALQMLLFLYEGKFDVIYIDPPYNTGDKNWKYNNKYVDSNDKWAHSRWLAMMEKRLKLAHRLLKSNGVLVCTIDEHEVHHLGMLLEDVFKDADRQMITIVNNPKGVTRQATVRFSRVEEYAFFCFLGDSQTSAKGDDLLTPGVFEDDPVTTVGQRPRWKGLLRSGTNARRQDRKHMFFPVLIDPERGAVVGAGEPLYDVEPNPEELVEGYAAAWPIRSDGSWGNWGVGAPTLRTLIEKGYVSVGSYDERRKTWPLSYLSEDLRAQLQAGALEVVSYNETKNVVDVLYTEEGSRRLKTVWHRTRHDAGVGGSDILRALLGDERLFDFPKSVYAVKDTLSALTRHIPDALILDFFGGSATTLHATMMLNEEVGGNRRCVVVTNNEVDNEIETKLRNKGVYPGDEEWEAAGIFEAVAKPRCIAALTGRKADGNEVKSSYIGGRPMSQPFEEQIEFYRLNYVDRDEVDLGWHFESILPALWMRAGALGERPEFKADSAMVIVESGNFAVLFDETFIRDFAKALRKNKSITHAYLLTDSYESFAEMKALLRPELDVVMLYQDYFRSFVANVERES